MSVLDELSQIGVSIWLDDLDRHRIESGNLANLIASHCVVGVTTNPSIFEKALTSGVAEYAPQLAQLKGSDVNTAVKALTIHDVQAACDIFHETWVNSNGVDGRVSLEVDPRLAHDTKATIAQARELWAAVDRKNLMIKIPATLAGVPAITQVIGSGISVNVTLIFSVERYRDVMNAWLEGLELAQSNGHDLATIESVASFFVSRVDAQVDKELDALGTQQAQSLRGKAAIANAQLAWAAFVDTTQQSRWTALSEQGAHVQRPLWASTGVKDPTYDDTRYVIELAAPGCVNTMPESTLNAVADHGVSRGDTVTGSAISAQQVWDELATIGIDRIAICEHLEKDGVAKFIDAWNQLLTSLSETLAEI